MRLYSTPAHARADAWGQATTRARSRPPAAADSWVGRYILMRGGVCNVPSVLRVSFLPPGREIALPSKHPGIPSTNCRESTPLLWSSSCSCPSTRASPMRATVPLLAGLLTAFMLLPAPGGIARAGCIHLIFPSVRLSGLVGRRVSSQRAEARRKPLVLLPSRALVQLLSMCRTMHAPAKASLAYRRPPPRRCSFLEELHPPATPLDPMGEHTDHDTMAGR